MINYSLDYNNPALKIKTRLSANRYGEMFQQDFSLSGSPYFVRPAGTVINLNVESELSRFADRGGALSLRMEINNIFDGVNEVYWGFPGAGRSFYTGLRYSFD